MLFDANRYVEESAMDNDFDMDQMTEAMILAELASFNEEQLNAFLESDLCQTLVEAGKMRKKTIVRLGAKDDLSRRETIAAMELARQHNDPLFEKLRINRIKERELLGKIRAKYGTKATKIAKANQKDYIKNRLPNKPQLFSNNPLR